MQIGQLRTQCSHNGESAKNIQNEVYKKAVHAYMCYHKRIKNFSAFTSFC